ncbi:MAG: hypothetical protein IT577_23765 [Verrucomicrobiae bacterium]|nr:hypothetical protein [Verrucomicrobiae bacterium]
MVKVALSRDTLSPRLQRALKSITSPSGLPTVLGRAGANALRAHFRSRNRTANALGGKRTNFWSRVAEAVQSPRVEGRSISVHVSHPHIAAKLRKWTAVPRKRKRLAIPVDAEGHGRSPRTFSDLTLAFRRKGGRLTLLLGRMASEGQFKAIYVLVESADIPEDPRALPERSTVAAALERAGAIYLRNEADR